MNEHPRKRFRFPEQHFLNSLYKVMLDLLLLPLVNQMIEKREISSNRLTFEVMVEMFNYNLG